jgi:hypothetical protein
MRTGLTSTDLEGRHLDQDVRQSLRRILADPLIPVRDSVRGFVYDVITGKPTEVLMDYFSHGSYRVCGWMRLYTTSDASDSGSTVGHPASLGATY